MPMLICCYCGERFKSKRITGSAIERNDPFSTYIGITEVCPNPNCGQTVVWNNLADIPDFKQSELESSIPREYRAVTVSPVLEQVRSAFVKNVDRVDSLPFFLRWIRQTTE